MCVYTHVATILKYSTDTCTTKPIYMHIWADYDNHIYTKSLEQTKWLRAFHLVFNYCLNQVNYDHNIQCHQPLGNITSRAIIDILSEAKYFLHVN